MSTPLALWKPLTPRQRRSAVVLLALAGVFAVKSEQEVMAAVNSLHGDKTLVIVAHRLSTVAGCDLLYRLEEGHVTRSGTFAEVTAS
jgi:ABC-type multidrug transport system fused ATPase/permease subunit